MTNLETSITFRMLGMVLKQKIELLKKSSKYPKVINDAIPDDVNEAYENGKMDGKISAFNQILNLIKE
jgi:hypothetical protein